MSAQPHTCFLVSPLLSYPKSHDVSFARRQIGRSPQGSTFSSAQNIHTGQLQVRARTKAMEGKMSYTMFFVLITNYTLQGARTSATHEKAIPDCNREP